MKNSLTKTQANNRKMQKFTRCMITALFTAVLMSAMGLTAFAEGEGGIANSADSFNTVVEFIVTWVQRIGGVIGFIGAVQFGMAFKNDDADGKTRGLMTLASGFIVIAICIAYNTLFKQA